MITRIKHFSSHRVPITGYVIRLEILDFDMPAPDYLYVGEDFDPEDNTSRYDTMLYSPVYSAGNELSIVYVHGSNQSSTGFHLLFTFEQRMLVKISGKNECD